VLVGFTSMMGDFATASYGFPLSAVITVSMQLLFFFVVCVFEQHYLF
jgi:hypothetical protein